MHVPPSFAVPLPARARLPFDALGATQAIVLLRNDFCCRGCDLWRWASATAAYLAYAATRPLLLDRILASGDARYRTSATAGAQIEIAEDDRLQVGSQIRRHEGTLCAHPFDFDQ